MKFFDMQALCSYFVFLFFLKTWKNHVSQQNISTPRPTLRPAYFHFAVYVESFFVYFVRCLLFPHSFFHAEWGNGVVIDLNRCVNSSPHSSSSRNPSVAESDTFIHILRTMQYGYWEGVGH